MCRPGGNVVIGEQCGEQGNAGEAGIVWWEGSSGTEGTTIGKRVRGSRAACSALCSHVAEEASSGKDTGSVAGVEFANGIGDLAAVGVERCITCGGGSSGALLEAVHAFIRRSQRPWVVRGRLMVRVRAGLMRAGPAALGGGRGAV